MYNKKNEMNKVYQQLLINYKNIFEITSLTKLVPTLEQYITDYDRFNDSRFKRKYKCEKDIEIREFIWSLINKINEINPFISVNEKDASILKNIKSCIKTTEDGMIISLLSELSLEIKNKDDSIEKNKKYNLISLILSIVGIAITIYFGIFSLI